MSLPLRQELPLAETWDLSLLYKDQAAYEVAVEDLKKQVTEFEANYAGTLDQTQQLEKALPTTRLFKWLFLGFHIMVR